MLPARTTHGIATTSTGALNDFQKFLGSKMKMTDINRPFELVPLNNFRYTFEMLCSTCFISLAICLTQTAQITLVKKKN